MALSLNIIGRAARIEEARQGDPAATAEVLSWVVECIADDELIPRDLRHYIGDALFDIWKGHDPRSVFPVENKKPKGMPKRTTRIRNKKIAWEVARLRNKKGKNREEAVAAVADKRCLSSDTVHKAYDEYKHRL